MNIITGIVIFHAVLFETAYAGTCEPFQISKNNLDKVLVGHSVGKLEDINHYECARECMSLAICKSIDYDRTENTCKLNDVDQSSADPLKFEIKKGSSFSNINEWPSAMVKGCSKIPCKQNQRCYVSGGSYVCRDITCVIGKQINHGKIDINSPGKNKFRDVASVKCDAGFVASPLEVKCQASGEWQYATCRQVSDCKQILDEVPKAKSGIYEIKLWSYGTIIKVNCDLETEGGGWTIFHRRIDGSVDFYRNFSEYENGFGSADGELWQGLKYIKELADQGTTELRLDMTNENDDTGEETYQDFKLTDGIQYKLNIGSGTANPVEIINGLEYDNLRQFSTFDRDASSRNCTVLTHGAWWYTACSYVNLNGLYVTPGTECSLTGASYGWCGHTHNGFNGLKALKRSSMMLRRK